MEASATAAASAYDVVVLGGGPAGSATALALRQRGVARVLIVEAGGYHAARIGESIPPDTRLLLERLGLWGAFQAEGHEPCLGSCSSWGDDAVGYNDYLFNPHGTGWHLDRRRFDVWMGRAAAERGAELLVGRRFERAERAGPAGFTLQLVADGQPPQTVRARFVVDATGGRSRFARAMGAQQRFHDRISCVAAFLALPPAAGFSRLTMLEAVDYGWWYAARLPGDRLVVVVASDAEIVKQAALHLPERWLAHLRATRHIAPALEGSALADAATLVRIAPSFMLDRVCGEDWLAVGDAASAYDPIASQGIYKALRDGLAAADAIVARLAGGSGWPRVYHSSIAEQFDDYLRNRNYFYGLEQRWPAAPFWRRRRERAAYG